MAPRWWRRLQMRWVNAAPTPAWLVMRDRDGEPYWYEWRDDDIPTLVVVHKGSTVGRANIVWNEKYCELADIVIQNPARRRCGLGAAMMREIVAHARAKGMQAIVGTIKPGDGGEPREYLREWYGRQGFQFKGNRLFMNLQPGK